MAKAMIEELWEEREKMADEDKQSIKTEVRSLERTIDQYMDRIVETDERTVINAYENQIRRLEEQKTLSHEGVKICGRQLKPFDDTFRPAMTFLANPQKLWGSNRLEDKRMVLRLVFAEKLPYQRDGGFRTVRTALTFMLLQRLKGSNMEVARPEGVEPPTLGSEVQYSIQLSYGRARDRIVD